MFAARAGAKRVVGVDMSSMAFKAMENVKENGLEVTDDVSVVEHLGKRVQITEGSYYNIKVTTPEDMFIAERLLNEEPKLRCV